MSSIGTMSLDSSLVWTQREIFAQATSSYQAEIDTTITMQSGLGSQEVNKQYFTAGTLISGGSVPFDLFNLVQTGAISTTINLSGGVLKTLLIKNTATLISGTGNNNNIITLKGTGAGGLISPFNSGYLGISIYPQTYKIFFEPNIGYSITTGARYFYLSDVVSGTSYELAILGVK